MYNPNCQSSLALTIERLHPGFNPNSVNPDCATIAEATTLFDQGLPLPIAPDVSNLTNISALSFIAESPKFRAALIQQFNLQVEQQFGANVLTIGYVGNIGQHLPETVNDINVPKPFSTRITDANYGTGARPLSITLGNLGSVGLLHNESVSNYNALQTSFQRRFSKGLSFDANYTWGKALSDVVGFSQEGAQGWSTLTRPASARLTMVSRGTTSRIASPSRSPMNFHTVRPSRASSSPCG